MLHALVHKYPSASLFPSLWAPHPGAGRLGHLCQTFSGTPKHGAQPALGSDGKTVSPVQATRPCLFSHSRCRPAAVGAELRTFAPGRPPQCVGPGSRVTPDAAANSQPGVPVSWSVSAKWGKSPRVHAGERAESQEAAWSHAIEVSGGQNRAPSNAPSKLAEPRPPSPRVLRRDLSPSAHTPIAAAGSQEHLPRSWTAGSRGKDP